MTFNIGRLRIELPCMLCRNRVGAFGFWFGKRQDGSKYAIHFGWLYFELT